MPGEDMGDVKDQGAKGDTSSSATNDNSANQNGEETSITGTQRNSEETVKCSAKPKNESKEGKPGRRQKGESRTDVLQVDDVPTKAWFILGASLPIFLVMIWYFWAPVILTPAVELLIRLYYFCVALSYSLTSPCPQWIWPDDLRVVNTTDGLQIQRYSGISRDMFVSLMDKGEPFVLSGIMKDWPAFGTYDCDYFINNYPDAEYHDWQAGEQIPIGDIPKRPGFKDYECAAGYLSMDMWDSTRKYTDEWLSQLETPDFMKEFIDFKLMRADVTGFIGMVNTGVTPHLDEVCSSLATLQFSGVKYWSVSRPEAKDGKLMWSKPYTFKVYPGDIMVWFTGQRHHTEIIEGCSFSLSFHINRPAPVTYFEDLRRTMSDVGEKECDRFFGEIEAADIRYLQNCDIINKGADSFVIQRTRLLPVLRTGLKEGRVLAAETYFKVFL